MNPTAPRVDVRRMARDDKKASQEKGTVWPKNRRAVLSRREPDRDGHSTRRGRRTRFQTTPGRARQQSDIPEKHLGHCVHHRLTDVTRSLGECGAKTRLHPKGNDCF